MGPGAARRRARARSCRRAPARAFGAMVRRRLRREPVAYILGRKGFRRIELAVDRRVLIPRPETELLVEVALELEPRDGARRRHRLRRGRARDRRRASRARASTATDTSEPALEVARANADRLGLAERVALRARDRCPDGRVRPRRRQPSLRERGRVGGTRARDPRVRAARGAGRRARPGSRRSRRCWRRSASCGPLPGGGRARGRGRPGGRGGRAGPGGGVRRGRDAPRPGGDRARGDRRAA